MLFRVLAATIAMFNVAVQYSISFLQSAHGTALLIGGGAFLLYVTLFPAIASSSASTSSRQIRRRSPHTAISGAEKAATQQTECSSSSSTERGLLSAVTTASGGNTPSTNEHGQERWGRLSEVESSLRSREDSQSRLSLATPWLMLSAATMVCLFLLSESCCADSREQESTSWARDTAGFYVPADISQLEFALLQNEAEVPSEELEEFQAARALQLYQHAKMLALNHHDAAAEWRYRESSRLAAEINRSKLAAHSLSRLGYFLMLRGRHRDALATVGEALRHDDDALGIFVQASLQRSLGQLMTTEDIDAALSKLELVAGRLPSPGLEQQREEAHGEILWWRSVAAGNIKDCLGANDAARFIICASCHVLWQTAPFLR
mmetsp:Transcript_17371/g.40520  ORF Transcript_17371/g.40520 Transcript_17371/m.40520 type:complete len:378 (-) Transcript_17371:254-1387(-)